MHPSHEDQLLRLKKVEGQVRGIQTMIEERRYCMDLLSQIRAVSGALRKIESGILKSHLQHCVNDAITSKDIKNSELILVNNGSNDNTKNIIQKHANENQKIKLVDIEKNIGFGNGIWEGFPGHFLTKNERLQKKLPHMKHLCCLYTKRCSK